MKKLKNILTYIGCIISYEFACLAGMFVKHCSYYKDLWLISERKTDARDNGYHFFKYLCQKHPEINCAYVIESSSPDYKKVKELGKTIEAYSFKNMLAFACAKIRISTHYMGYAPDTYRFAILSRFGIACKKNAILRHGITANDLSELHYPKTKTDLLVCSCVPEYEHMKKNYNHPSGVVQKLGLCRYDRLLEDHNIKKQILIMPTWRLNLRALSDEDFVKSDYYREFSSLINNEEVLRLSKKYDYDIVLYLHVEFQKFSHLFASDNPRVKIMNLKDIDIQDLLMESCLMVTDYSSVFFDFAYMSKPIVYLQFDENDFYNTQYKRGYFNCRNDGFGPVVTNAYDAAKYICNKIEHGMCVDDIYIYRIKKFFGRTDGEHCKKTYEAICDILNGEINKY